MGNILDALQKAHRQKRERVEHLRGAYEDSGVGEGGGLKCPRLVILDDPTSATAEQFHMARNIIRQEGMNAPIKTVLITSPMSTQGGPLVTANLAASFVTEPEGDVLLIDAIPGGQRLSAAFGATALPGLYTYLAEASQAGIDPDLLLPLCVKTPVRRLQLLPAGTPALGDSPFLQRELAEVLRTLTDYYRMIFLDVPPVLENMDVAVFAAVADAVILVVESGSTSRDSLARGVQLLRGSGASVLGCILSGASETVPRWLRRLLVGPSA